MSPLAAPFDARAHHRRRAGLETVVAVMTLLNFLVWGGMVATRFGLIDVPQVAERLSTGAVTRVVAVIGQ